MNSSPHSPQKIRNDKHSQAETATQDRGDLQAAGVVKNNPFITKQKSVPFPSSGSLMNFSPKKSLKMKFSSPEKDNYSNLDGGKSKRKGSLYQLKKKMFD